MDSLKKDSRNHLPKKKSKLNILNSQKVAPYVFVLPFIVSFLVLTLYPTIKAFIMSFQNILPGQVSFIGWNNYVRALNSPAFYKALQNTSIYMILTVVILVAIPMIFAVMLNSNFVRLRNFFRSGLFIPSLTSIVVAGIIFRLIFADSDTAIANQVIGFFGLDPLDWRTTGWSAMFLMVLLATWRWLGVNILYFLAGIQNIPDELYESADIDGANVFQKFYNITFPLLKPIIIFVTTISIIGGFRVFEESFIFWETNSPGNIGLTLVAFLYQQGIQQNDMGYGSAIGVIVLMIVFIVSFINLIVTGAFKRSED